MDPNFITSNVWSDLTANLMLLWLFLGSVILFAGSLLFAIGVIPSLVGSGHLPSPLPGPAKVVRPLFFLTTALGVVGIAFTLSQLIPGLTEVLAEITGWDAFAQ